MSSEVRSREAAPEVKSAVWDVEMLIDGLGGCGRYQVLAFLLVKGAKASIIWTMYAMAFNGQQPDFFCVPNTGVIHGYARNGSAYDNECSAENHTGCKDYQFKDDMKTIVNEVTTRIY